MRKKIKPYDYLIINLMIGDLLMIIPNFPLAAYNCYYGKWMFRQWLCNFYAFCGALSGFLNISTMVIISIERYNVIRTPFILNPSKMTKIKSKF